MFEFFQGIANGMFSHIMGFKHRQEFVRKIHENTPDAERMMDLSQRELLEIARKYSENKDDLNAKIRCRRSDEVSAVRSLTFVTGLINSALVRTLKLRSLFELY